MLITAPIGFAVLVYLVALRWATAESHGAPWRSTVMWLAVCLGLATTAITEVLSLLRALTPQGVFLSWLMASGLPAAVLLRQRGPLLAEPPTAPATGGKIWPAIVLLASILGGTLVIALLSPPNNWDSMTYHMSRVMEWSQNRSLEFYPTQDPRQLWMAPFAEYAILHLRLLLGNDGLANLVQWLASLTAAVGASLIALRFGAGYRTQLMAALLSVSVPMGILQASTTQNDYVAACWSVCCLYFLLRKDEDTIPPFLTDVAAGLSLGLAVLTKPSVILFLLPFLGWRLVDSVRQHRLFGAAVVSLLIFVAAAPLVAGHFSRNQALYGNFTGPGSFLDGGSRPNSPANAEVSLPIFLSNVVRNVALEVATPSPTLNAWLDAAVRVVHRWLGLSVEDPRSTWTGTRFGIGTLRPHEDYAANTLHTILFGLSLAVCVAAAARRKNRSGNLSYGIALLTGFLLFCFVLRWSPWQGRLHLPLFALAAPFAAVALSSFVERGPGQQLLVLALGVSSIPYLLMNEARPLVGSRSLLRQARTETLFNNNPDLRDSYERVTQFLLRSHCRDIGLILGGDGWNYPLWALLEEGSQERLRVRDIGVSNETVRLSPPVQFAPCAVVTAFDRGGSFDIEGRSVKLTLSSPSLFVYLPTNLPPARSATDTRERSRPPLRASPRASNAMGSTVSRKNS